MFIMRAFAALRVSAVLLITVSTALASDFDALLSELTFDQPPAAGDAETLTLDVAAERTAESLEPAPPQVEDELTMPPQPHSPQPLSDLPATPAAEPETVVPASPPSIAPPVVVDMNEAFAAQECSAPPCAACQGEPCGGPRGGCARCGCHDAHGCHGCQLHGSLCTTCVPYHPPRLPSSTFYQYFRTNACNVDVWNGYQNRCCFAAEHTRGECECFEKDRRCSTWDSVVCSESCPPQACADGGACAGKSTCGVNKRCGNRIFDIGRQSPCDPCDEGCDVEEACCDGMLECGR
jgi:hypothetical protein